jgi:hypothetical protein
LIAGEERRRGDYRRLRYNLLSFGSATAVF